MTTISTLLILHTVLTHLINWLSRNFKETGFGLSIVFSGIEFITILIILDEILN